MSELWRGSERLLGEKALLEIQHLPLMIIGLGGVGSWVAEALSRFGLLNLTLVDLDDICLSNINRQAMAYHSTVGQFKTDALAKKLRDINPSITLDLKNQFFNTKSLEALLTPQYALVIDCLDDIENKILLLTECKKRNINIITCGGSGGRLDPLQIKTSDLAFSTGDKLLYRLRKSLRKDYSFPRESEVPFGIPCVYSIERTRYQKENGDLCYSHPDPRKNSVCETRYGSAVFVTGSFGFHLAALAIQQLTQHHTLPLQDEA